MVKKYKFVRVELPTYNRFVEKKQKMEKRVKSWTGKKLSISLTKILDEHSKRPIEIKEGELIKLTKLRRVKKSDLY